MACSRRWRSRLEYLQYPHSKRRDPEGDDSCSLLLKQVKVPRSYQGRVSQAVCNANSKSEPVNQMYRPLVQLHVQEVVDGRIPSVSGMVSHPWAVESLHCALGISG